MESHGVHQRLLDFMHKLPLLRQRRSLRRMPAVLQTSSTPDKLAHQVPHRLTEPVYADQRVRPGVLWRITACVLLRAAC